MVCTGLGAGLGGGAGGVLGGARDFDGLGAAGAVVGAAAGAAVGGGLWWWWWRCRRGEGLGLGLGAALEADGLTVAWGGGWLLTVVAGAVRANTAAKPTVASAPSWVARQVRRDKRRSPRNRASSAGSWSPCMANDPTTECIKPP